MKYQSYHKGQPLHPLKPQEGLVINLHKLMVIRWEMNLVPLIVSTLIWATETLWIGKNAML